MLATDLSLSAALRSFPEQALAIRRLAARSESFRGLCADLMEAERALECWSSSSSADAAARSEEYSDLTEDLRKELEQILHEEDLLVRGIEGGPR